MKIAQIAQKADDLGRAVAFYEHLLGQKVAAVFDPPGLAFFDLDGTRLLLEKGANSALIYLVVKDVPSRTEDLRRQGITVVVEPHLIFQHTDNALGHAHEDEWMSFIEDSEGNTVGLVSWTPTI
jgi:methylmalonyl-CoA/ethylmalonyl-CoA epimerase